MKKKVLFIGLLSTAFLAGGLLINNKTSIRPASALGPYSIADTAYEAAIFEQYCGGSEYGYGNDKPLGSNFLAGHLYGGNGAASLSNYSTSLNGVNESLTWTFTNVGAYNPNPYDVCYLILKNTSYENATNSEYENYNEDLHNIILNFKGVSDPATSGYFGAMISDVAITDINDLSFYWRSDNAYSSSVAVFYQLYDEGEHAFGTWTRLMSSANTDGTRGWDAKCLSTFNLPGWQSHELHGSTAKIALALRGGSGADARLGGVLINYRNSAVRYLNALSYRTGMCDGEDDKSIALDASDNRHNKDFFELCTEHLSNSDAEFLVSYTVAGSHTSAPNALDLYNDFAKFLSKSPLSANQSVLFFDNKNNSLVIAITVSSLSIIALGTFLVSKKTKKQK